jgi:hypothetical protein
MQHAEIETLQLTLDEPEVNFATARHAAEALAAERIAEPFLIAWYDGKKGEEHPAVPECQHKPGWLSYAEGHGGQLRVDVNGGEYCFVFAPS